MTVIIDGNNTPTAGGVGYGDGTELAFTTAGTSGQLLQSNGASAPTWVAAPSATAASQAEMEAASSNTVFATPLNLKWHPGVAKMWLKCGTSGNILASLNITSVSDTGVGQVGVTIATDFSSADYVILGTAESNTNGQRYVVIRNQAAGTFDAYCDDQSGTDTDPVSWYFAGFGDQS